MRPSAGRLEWPDPTPDGPTPEEEALMDAARECQRCGGSGRVLIYHCEGIRGTCECGYCPDVGDCPECVGQIECHDEAGQQDTGGAG